MSERRDANDAADGMRLDVYLSRSRLIMPRQSAKRACDNDIVWINGRQAKPSTEVHVGDRITIQFTDQDLTVEIEKYPRKSIPKSQAGDHYRVLEDRRFNA